jgi:tetratricopeptide (TPR) repeat protein
MARVEGGIEITYVHGKILVPDALIADAVLEADAAAAPLTDEEKEQAKKGFVRFEGKWVTPDQREALVAKRVEKHRLELETIRSHGEWRNRWIEETRYFRFEHTVPPAIFEPYRDAMEAYFNEFLKTWKIQKPRAEERLPVCFYADEESFLQVSGVKKGVLGYFHPTRRDLNIFYERLDPSLSEDVMFHEANHYLQQLVDEKFWVPHFPGESLAEYYGASSWDPVKKKLTVGLIQEGRLCEIQSDIDSGDTMDLVRLVSTDRLYQHYTWGWSLVHFLMTDPRYTAKFQKFFLNLADAKKVERVAVNGSMWTISQPDVMTVFARELGLKDADAVRKLDAEWHDYIDGKLKLVTASGKERAGFRAKQDGRKIKAGRLLKEALAMGSRNPLAYHSLAEMAAEDGRLNEAADMWKQALALDPLNGLFYSRWSFYEANRNKAEAERMQALAFELGTDDFWVFLELGDRKPEPGKKPGGDEPGGGKKPGGNDPPDGG